MVVLTTGLAIFLVYPRGATQPTNPSQHPAPTELFRFATVGDFDLNDKTRQTLTQIKKQNVDFVIGLGDMSYGKVDEYTWCDAIKDQVGETLPFQVIAGNHDVEPASSRKSQGHIDRFATCLPNRMQNMSGIYGQQYYFDYKSARVVAIAPDIMVNDKKYTYDVGTPERKWLIETLDRARADNKKWVFVAMHKNCISYGVKTCEISEDLFNLLIEKQVTIILQGHEHAYLRSKQLAVNQTTCMKIPANIFNPGCVVNNETGSYSAKDGSVVLINGTGGVDLRPLSETSPLKGYFAAGYGSNKSPTHGPSIIKVFSDRVSVDYISGDGRVMDYFEITE